MTDAEDRRPEPPGQESGVGGENAAEPETTHEGAPHDRSAKEPLGPLTPDDETPAGDTPEAHDEINPHDLPPGHPGRRAAEEQAEADDDGARTTRGDDDLAQASPGRDERLERSSEQRR